MIINSTATNIFKQVIFSFKVIFLCVCWVKEYEQFCNSCHIFLDCPLGKLNQFIPLQETHTLFSQPCQDSFVISMYYFH